jgi:tRNA-dihydrouridine synthase B
MKIGPIELENSIVFAPLAGISNLPMRLLAKSAGCALVYSEMISANGLVHGAAKTWQLLASTAQERPLTVQLFGADPGILAEAARQVETAGADIIDINFGCAVKKILKSGSGAALMQDMEKAEILLKTVRAAIKKPLTIKIRAGWDASGSEALRLARIARDCGVDAIAVHPRTARQAFSGRADWPLIARIKAALDIPVIGNGDITTAEEAARMIAETGCDGVMVGRAAIGNPFIFNQIADRLAGRPVRTIPMTERFAAMFTYIETCVRYLGETSACYMLRSRLGWFAKGLPQATQFRKSLHCISSQAHAEELLLSYRDSIMPTD